MREEALTYWQKPVVNYMDVKYLRIGEACLILPANHPSELVSNAPKWAVTSLVVNYDPASGEIETENTVYIKDDYYVGP